MHLDRATCLTGAFLLWVLMAAAEDVQRAGSEVVVFRFARREQPDEAQDRRRREVVTDVLQTVGPGKPRGDVRRERGAENAGKVESQRSASVTHRRREKLG